MRSICTVVIAQPLRCGLINYNAQANNGHRTASARYITVICRDIALAIVNYKIFTSANILTQPSLKINKVESLLFIFRNDC